MASFVANPRWLLLLLRLTIPKCVVDIRWFELYTVLVVATE